uniref:Membrane protein n=1 Tax=Dikerogammarus haemobaphes virus 1 TaxID=2704946 RepID=A0A6G9HEU3_9VIRU|nr:membrane protein [Dikerogammarus haemobaphes virus 1]
MFLKFEIKMNVLSIILIVLFVTIAWQYLASRFGETLLPRPPTHHHGCAAAQVPALCPGCIQNIIAPQEQPEPSVLENYL